jgi:hypothetical protein
VIAYASRSVGLRLGPYLKQAFLPPLACVAPLAAILVASRLALSAQPALALFGSLAAGGIVTGPLYWRYLLNDELRDKARGLAARGLRTLRLAPRRRAGA